jgi:lysozyme
MCSPYALPDGLPANVKTTPATIEQISSYEKLMLALYNDADHNATIGYGHLVHMGPVDGTESAEFRAGIGKERALELLAEDVAWAEHCVTIYVTAPLTQNQFDALVSFTYNVGVKDLHNAPFRKLLNAGNYSAVPAHLLLYDMSGGVRLAGLVIRRAWEADLFRKAA